VRRPVGDRQCLKAKPVLGSRALKSCRFPGQIDIDKVADAALDQDRELLVQEAWASMSREAGNRLSGRLLVMQPARSL
jgi:hypothetical protein